MGRLLTRALLLPAAYAHRLATGKDAALTGMSIGVLYIVAKLSALFSIIGLAYTGE